MRQFIFTSLLTGFFLTTVGLRAEEDGFVTIFDGKTLDGWKINENEDTWTLTNGALICHGERSHIFYIGDDQPFVNFEFKAEVMTTPGSNSGIYFHTKFLASGWPNHGYESQVNISHRDPIKTGSLWNVVNVNEAAAKDGEYWTQHIIVKDKHVVVKINGKTVVDYTEPKDPPLKDGYVQRINKGTFALQGHDPGSKVSFKNIRVKRLP